MRRQQPSITGSLILAAGLGCLTVVGASGSQPGDPRRVFEAGAERILHPVGSGAAREADTGLILRVHPEVSVPVARRALVAPLAARYGAQDWRESGQGGYYLFVYQDGAAALAAAERLWADGIAASPVLARKREPRFRPPDPLFSGQWHLRNRGGSGAREGIDLNVTGAWKNYRGRGIRVGIVDDGVELHHPDLKANTQGTLHYDFNRNRRASRPGRRDAHGTAVAGLVGAGANRLGGVGVAPSARLVGLRLIGEPATDRQERQALGHRNDRIHIYNNSWGPPDTGRVVEAPGPLATGALAQAVKFGRQGRGNVFVWSAGNGRPDGDEANYDGYANAIETIAVGAVSDRGRRTSESEQGANLAVVAPSSSVWRQGLITTDRQGRLGYNRNGSNDGYVLRKRNVKDRDYTNDFGGTSGAAPLVSGVVALLLEANPDLGWREVQDILIRTARRVDSRDADWRRNGAGLWFNHKYGAGLVDAAAAVQAAERAPRLGGKRTIRRAENGLNLRIPDRDSRGVTVAFDLSADTDLQVEHVQFKVSVRHGFRGDLRYELVSPSGMRSVVAARPRDSGRDLRGWTFMTLRHWGESSAGTWKLVVKDVDPSLEGTLESAELVVHGVPRTKTRSRHR